MDLSTTYLGLNLKNPIVPSAGPLSTNIDNIKAMEDAGAGAIVLYSLFEEEIEHDALELNHYTLANTDSFPEAQSFFPVPYDIKIGGEDYLNHLRKAKESVNIPIIGSLNGKKLGGWVDYAKKIEQAGADALELNIYILSADHHKSCTTIENTYLDIVKSVLENVKIPVAVKLHPFFTSVSELVFKLDQTGVKGLVLFNRFYQPDIDLDKLEVIPNVLLSTPMDLRLPLRWTAILYGQVKADLAATSGIYSAEDALKLIMAGSKITQMLSCLLKNGIPHIAEVLKHMVQWMEEHEYESLNTMRGSMSYINIADPAQFERANYMKVLHSYK
ncbi:MAG: dihydroorotate dehydrogenase-like protein [Ignavibacteriaceae bacterium]|nr:dihydroorotate dehydrogenase-like protein [Ignavibacteriaceae bacterium]